MPPRRTVPPAQMMHHRRHTYNGDSLVSETRQVRALRGLKTVSLAGAMLGAALRFLACVPATAPKIAVAPPPSPSPVTAVPPSAAPAASEAKPEAREAPA